MQQFQSFLSGQEKETEDVGRFTPDQIEAFNRGLFSEPEPQETQVEVSIPPEQREEYNQILQKPQDTYAQSLGAAYTLDDLENDQEFQFRADRFMSEIEKNEQIFEYLRDADFSLSSAMVRAFEVEGWTDQAKLDLSLIHI